jgi:hypothetical protein
MNKGMKQIYDKQMFDIMSNMSNFLKFESIRAKKGTKVDVDIPDFVTTSFGNFTLNVLFTKLSISVIIFFPEMALTSNPKSIPLTLAV